MQLIKKVSAAAILFLLSASAVFAQKLTVSGTAVDTEGEPLIGAVVYEEGNTSNGTTTDIDGKYTISVSGKGTLVFSSLGYLDLKEPVNGRTQLNVVLQSDATLLDAAEVVSDGYSTVAKRDLTGSVSKVSMDKLMQTPVTNFDQALNGRIAGVVVSTGDGAVGSTAQITIRGNNSLTQSNAPLYVIDGFPSESSMATSISPADIESVDVLKDASATAIYGARGANGVIVINTKHGVEGKPKVNFSATWTGNTLSNKIDLMGAYDFVALTTEILASRNSTNSYLTNDDNEIVYNVEDYRDAKTYDWQDAIYRNSLTQNYNISLSGGNAKAGNRYNLSFSALDQNGIIVKSNFQRYQGKINFSQKIGEKVTVNVIGNYSRAVTNGITPTDAQQSSSASGWLLYSVWGYRPALPIKYSGNSDDFMMSSRDEEVVSADDYRFNPALTVRNEYRKTIVNYVNANGNLVWEIIPDLKLKIAGSYTMNNRRREEFNGTKTYTGCPNSPSGKGINGSIGTTIREDWTNDNTLTWVKHIKGKHHLNIMGGLSFSGEKMGFTGVSAQLLSTESLGLNGLNTGEYQTVTPYQYDWTLMSLFGRINYNYRYKYYLTASMRGDGSSKFPKGNRWGYFPSGSLAWNFNREDWLKNVSWLKNGKVRLSWGMTGNNRTTTPYDFYAQMATLPGSQESYDYVFDGKPTSGYFPSNMQNDQLKWETTEQWNVGLDLAFFEGDRIKLTADAYLKNTRDLLLSATVPASSGYTTVMMNVGSMRNAGLEFTLEATPIAKKNFTWNASFNIAFNRNTVTELSADQYSLLRSVSWDQKYNSQYAYITQVGKPTGMMYGYIYDGTYKADDFEGGALKNGVAHLESYSASAIRPGDPKYRDINGDGIVNDDDRTIIGCGQPVHTGGFSNSFYFYGFDLNIFMSWSYGNDVLNANRLIFENGSISNLNQLTSYRNRWTESNPNSDIPRVMANGMNVYSSRVVEDGSFLRIKNISLGYTLPRKALYKMRMDTFRIYVSADNLFTFTKYSGPDPEVSTRSSVLTPGFDWSAYPRARSFTLGVSLTF